MPDPDLEKSWGGGGGLPPKFFRPFRPQFGPKSGGARAPLAPPPDLPLEIPTLSYT